MMWKILRHYGIPEKLVSMIRLLYDDYQAQVLHNGELTEAFEVKSGVKQGCLLSPLLFVITLDWAIRRAYGDGRTGIQWTLTTRLEDLEFADDIGLLSQTIRDMRTKCSNLEREGDHVGLKVNASNTKEMRIQTLGNANAISVAGEDIERVNSFTYLGSVVSTSGGTDEDIEARCRKAQHAFSILLPGWKARALSLRTKLRIFRSNVLSILLYGCETWRMTKKIEAQLQTFVNKRLRIILGIFYPNWITNDDLWRRTRQEKIATIIRRRRWRWLRHTLRKADTSITKQALTWNPQGTRKKGRPRTSWRRTIAADLEVMGRSWGQTRQLAQDRQRWRRAVEALCFDAEQRH
jgi:hypothetical protein